MAAPYTDPTDIANLKGRTNSDADLCVEIVAGAGAGGTSATDDSAFTPGTTAYTPVGGIVTADSVDSGDGGAFAMLANRQQKITLYDSSGNEVSVGGGTQYTEDAAAAANPVGNAIIVVRDDARSGSITSADGDNIALRGTNAGEVYVKHVDAVPVTTVIPGSGATNLGKAEDAGHTSGDVGVFALGVQNTAQNAAVTGTDADYSQFSTTKTGAVNIQYAAEDFAVLGSNFVNKPFNLTGAQTDAIIWSPAAGKRWYVTSFYYCVSAACTVTFEDDTTGGDVFMGIGGEHAANSGATNGNIRTPLFSTEDAADLVLTTSAGNIRGFVSGYEV